MVVGMLLGLLAGASTGGCLGTSATDCASYAECSTCVMEAACSFCLETNACIADDATCPGDRAQTPDMCAE
jgi:hypothetical protein